MEKPKILFLTSSYPRFEGDTNGNFVYELAKRMTDSFDVFVISPSFPGCKFCENLGNITIYRHRQFFFKKVQLAYGSDIMAKIKKNYLYLFVVPFFLLFQFSIIYKVQKKHGIKLIHAHWLLPQGLLAVTFKRLFNKKIKIICTSHGADINGFTNSVSIRLIRFVLKSIDELTVVSNSLKEKAKTLGYKNVVHVLPMGIDTQIFSFSNMKDNTQESGHIKKNIILFVGGLIERKGINLLIEAFPKILTIRPNTSLVIIGEGNLKVELLRLIKRYNIEDSVMFLGEIPNVKLPDYYCVADILVLPSLSEGFGLVLIEAMSCETLVLASDLAEISDIIIDRKTGFYFKTGNINSLSEKIIYILNNLNNLNIVKRDARNYVVEKFDWVQISNKYKLLYTNLFRQ